MAESLRFADAQLWFVVSEPSAGVFAIREPLHDEDVRSYLVGGSQRALLIDTGMGVGDIRSILESLTDLPITVVNSHSHWDHIGGNWQFDDIAIHSDEAEWLADPELAGALKEACTPERLRGPLPPGVTWESLSIPPSQASTLLHGGERFDLGGRVIEAIHTPGHADGLLVFLDRQAGVLVITDAVYPGRLYARVEDCDPLTYSSSLARLARLVPILNHVHPSHNADEMPAALITSMSDAMAEVVAGRKPDEVDDRQATHWFAGFGICVTPGYRGSEAE